MRKYILLPLVVMIWVTFSGHTYAQNIHPEYESDFGPLKLTITGFKTVLGRYNNDDGIVHANLHADGKILGYWTQPTGTTMCRMKLYGNYFWGSVAWETGPSGDLIGKRAYCEDPIAHGEKWDATRISGPRPQTALDAEGPTETLSKDPLGDLVDQIVR